jgi:hypothetical protein
LDETIDAAVFARKKPRQVQAADKVRFEPRLTAAASLTNDSLSTYVWLSLTG